jgi:WhiB family redox-sensing transcriptional regulator
MPENAYQITPPDQPDPWESRACKGKPTQLFFGSQGSVDTMRAKNICAECPVRMRCLDAAMEWPEAEDHGVLGGLDEWERRKLRQRQTA